MRLFALLLGAVLPAGSGSGAEGVLPPIDFPDLIAVQVTPEAGIIPWSRSVYGHSDLGVNRRRLLAWPAALDAALPVR